uniref:ANK_REP_REGION domain-containing protein n=1 Tax=Macrostomum lignano TaxID=282301 RepID=A0A1I8HGX0_9PLAT
SRLRRRPPRLGPCRDSAVLEEEEAEAAAAAAAAEAAARRVASPTGGRKPPTAPSCAASLSAASASSPGAASSFNRGQLLPRGRRRSAAVAVHLSEQMGHDLVQSAGLQEVHHAVHAEAEQRYRLVLLRPLLVMQMVQQVAQMLRCGTGGISLTGRKVLSAKPSIVTRILRLFSPSPCQYPELSQPAENQACDLSVSALALNKFYGDERRSGVEENSRGRRPLRVRSSQSPVPGVDFAQGQRTGGSQCGPAANTARTWPRQRQRHLRSCAALRERSSAAPACAEKNFWNFFKNPATLSQVARSGETKPQQKEAAAEVLVVPTEASVHGGEPILLLLPRPRQGADQPPPKCRYCLVFEGSNRRHVTSCEIALAQRGLFSRVPEHDIPERVELSVFADSQRLHSLAFNFTPDPLLGVAADIADKFPLVPESLSSLASGGQAAADTDRRLCAALRKCGRLADAAAETGEPDGGEPPPRRTAFHCLAEAGWLESLAQLLRLTGQPEFWLLGQPESEGGRTAVQLLRERRFRSLLASPGRLRAWLEQLDGRASRLQGQEDSVVKVRSWRTPSGADLVFMTTNKEKADTPLEQDLSIFPHLEVGHVEDQRDPVPDSTPTKETACAQTEVGRSIEDLLDSQTASAAVAAYRYDCGHFAETDSLVLGPSGEMSMSHSMSQSMSPSMSHSMSQSDAFIRNPVLFDSPSDEMRSLQQQQQQQQQQLEHASRSISTSSLIEDVARQQTMRRSSILARPGAGSWEWGGRIDGESSLTTRGQQPALGSGQSPRHRKKRKSFLVQAERQQPGQRRGQAAAARSKEAGRDWQHMSTAGESQLQESAPSARPARAGLPPDAVHNADACRSQTVPCLPPMASQAACGAAATAATAADSGFACATYHRLPLVLHSRQSHLRRLAEVSEEPFRDR